jgi:sporulation protein YlmC with PRC-barrel domain
MTLTRLARLDDMRVVGEDGRAIGRVFEIRSPGPAETEPTRDARDVDCLLVGRRGLLERLGWKQVAPRAIPWRDVRAIDGRTVRVRGTVEDYKLLEAT